MLMFGVIGLATIIVVSILQFLALGLKLNPRRSVIGKILDVLAFAIVVNVALFLFNSNEVFFMILLLVAYIDLRIFSAIEFNNKKG